MSTDLTGAEIDAIQDRFATDGDPTHDDVWTLIDYARSVPARLTSSRQEGRQEGFREGIEMAARWHEQKANMIECGFAPGTEVDKRCHCTDAAAIRALSPPPAEPCASRETSMQDEWMTDRLASDK